MGPCRYVEAGRPRQLPILDHQAPEPPWDGASLGVIEELLERGETHNVFICSALFDGEGIKAENVTGGRVVWVDIDPPRLKDKSIDQARMPDHMRWLKGPSGISATSGPRSSTPVLPAAFTLASSCPERSLGMSYGRLTGSLHRRTRATVSTPPNRS